jgi:hypothetical protein
MAEQKMDQNLGLVYTLGVAPGIKRDGTTFESREFTDGTWTRFQRGVPRKMGGYRQMFRDPNGIPRGIISNSYNALNYIFTGNATTLDAFTTGTNLGVGSGPFPAKIMVGYSEFALVSTATPNFVVAGDQTTLFPTGAKVVFDQTPGSTVYTVSSSSYTSPNTTVILTTAFAGSPTSVWLANTYYQPDADNLWQFDIQYNPQGGALQVIAHPGRNLSNIDSGVETQVLAGNILPGAGNVWEFYGLADSEGANPTYAPITVDGGVCVLYPFIFVYGSNGFIANNHVDATYEDQNFNDWNGALANRVNMAAGKIVKGIPVRGGTQSPSGLFWATDSLIRVSFTNDPTQYWRYDILSSQISIMSSSSVVEMDGIYYWMGVDRFYQYNGSVSVVPNDKNVNWLFDNLNFDQRQKVWATKVPRYNEIWFFYPRGTATECTDAIVYNVKDKLWYDAGEAEGARRSCGYTTEVFPTPIWCDWQYVATFGSPATVIATPSGEPAPAANQFYLSGDQTTVFVPGSNFQFSTVITDDFYEVDTAAYTAIGNFTLVTATENFSSAPGVGQRVFPVSNGYTIWQQEFGINSVSDDGTLAIESSITTCDISWVGGNPAGDTPTGVNRRIHLRRIEPDFLQDGDMTVQVIGRKFARGEESLSPVFTFGPDDGKVDMRIENRESRLQFTSNTVNGNYEMGRILITAEYGDERP